MADEVNIDLLDATGKKVGTVAPAPAFSVAPNTALLHQSVLRHLSNRRAGTADTKTRDDVRGGGRKPWRQKGTGRARQGSIRSPQWRKGGVVFGPHPRSYVIDMNKRQRRIALAQGIAQRCTEHGLSIIDVTGFAPVKTKEMLAVLFAAGEHKCTLFVLHKGADAGAGAIALAARNIPHVKVIAHDELSVHALFGHERIIMTQAAYDGLAEVCGG
ncbi:MAG TPA: 50S ribosomal protein L4 [Candidatus Eremiobacteraceae bacterium]|nr:50S ribosomal protein L4 [Candidatus Eremiobacteraceae bacterium]